MLTLQELYDFCYQRFPNSKGRLRLLIAHYAHQDVAWTFTHKGAVLEKSLCQSVKKAAEAIHQGVPLARVLGYKDFYNNRFFIEHTLEPRPETEGIVEAAIAFMSQRKGEQRVLDIGVGSGCVLLSILASQEHVQGVGLDISQDALTTARKNATVLKLEERVQWQNVCMGKAQSLGLFDCIVSNPPYIESQDIDCLDDVVKQYDPRIALDGGSDGLQWYNSIFSRYKGFLKSDGKVIVEIGCNQEKDIIALAKEKGWHLDDQQCDLAGIVRILLFTPN